MKSLEPTKLAYIANLLDTEGNISIGRSRKDNDRPWSYRTKCSIGSNNKKLIQSLLNMTGIGGISMSTVNRGKAFWYLKVPEMRDFLEAIKPYLVLKKKQADIALKFLNHHKKGEYFTEEERKERFEMYIKILDLNRS